MDEVKAINTVVEQCTELEGFLVKLHSHDEFDDDKFELLSTFLREYASILGDRSTVDRKVAGCLLALSQELVVKLNQRNSWSEDFYKRVEQAHITITEITDEILPT